jgi:hypothetical protein
VWLALSLAGSHAAVGTRVAGAGSCPVPSGSHPTIQSAVDDPGCDPILLSSQTYVEAVAVDRSVTVQGASSAASVIHGQVTVEAGAVELAGLTVSTDTLELAGRFHQAVLAEAGARLTGDDRVVVHRPLLFGDSFETGTTAAWSATVP